METEKKSKTHLLLNEILRTNKVYDSAGNEYDLESNIDNEEGQFLEKLISKNGCSSTIEVGCACGISSLFICGAKPPTNSFHTIIDPFQSTEWKNIGVSQLQKAGIENFKLIEKKSEIALPELLDSGATFDFAFIDGWHTFDHTLLDMFYLNKMLKVGGIMVIDDVGMKAVERAVNYFVNYPAYEFVDGVKIKNTISRNSFENYILNPLSFMTKALPAKVREEIFSAKVVNKSITGYSMVALKKIKEDGRPWNWFMNF